MKSKRIFLTLWMVFTAVAVFSQSCYVRNNAFQSGEKLVYKIYYNWGPLWLSAGEVTFRAKTTDYKGHHCYHFSGIGSTYPKYDWFYKVRDTFESYADTFGLRPLRFIRNTSEGGTHTFNDCVFDYKKSEIYTGSRINDKPFQLDSVHMPDCTFDVLTAIYNARCINFSNYQLNDTIPYILQLNNKVYHVYIRYLGKEVYKSDEFGTFRCIKFSALLISGTIFKGGESMTVWVTDDKNRIPLYVETPIILGSIKVHLIKYDHLLNPMSSKLKSN